MKRKTLVLIVFKISIISFPPKIPQKARLDHLPHNCALRIASKPSPAFKKVYYSLRHNPSYVNPIINSTPQGIGDLTMTKEMIYKLPTLTHTTLVNHNNMFPKVINGEDLP